MTGPDYLNYDVQLPSAGASLIYGGGTPTTTVPLEIGAGNTGSTTVQVSLPPGQIVGAGTYADASTVLHVFDRTESTLTLLKAASFSVSGSVAPVCHFGAPLNPTLNFSAAIDNGLPRSGYSQNVTFQDVSCTAPSLVRLSGNAMQPSQPAAPTAVFDNFIDFRAAATFSGATAVLDTTVANDAVSGARNAAGGATVNGSVRIDVNLLAGKPLLPGAYASVLTLSIDPNP